MLNKTVIIGRLTGSTEIRRTSTGKAVSSFTIAVQRDIDREKADFIDCVAWGSTAEFIAKYFGKGSMIAIEGRLQSRSWQDNDNRNHKATEIVAERVYFCGEKRISSEKESYALEEFEPIEETGTLPF